MADGLDTGGHVVKTNVADDLISVDSMVTNLTLASDM